MLKEFKEFALKGNVVDLAVAVIIGGAFGKIVSSLVNDIIMPVIGVITAGTDFSSLKLILRDAVIENGEVIIPEASILYGAFIQNIIDFLIVAVCMFAIVKVMNSLKKKEAEEVTVVDEPEISEEVLLLRDIKSILEKK